VFLTPRTFDFGRIDFDCSDATKRHPAGNRTHEELAARASSLGEVSSPNQFCSVLSVADLRTRQTFLAPSREVDCKRLQ